MKRRGLLTYLCVAMLAFGGAGTSLSGIDESAAPVVENWPFEHGGTALLGHEPAGSLSD